MRIAAGAMAIKMVRAMTAKTIVADKGKGGGRDRHHTRLLTKPERGPRMPIDNPVEAFFRQLRNLAL